MTRLILPVAAAWLAVAGLTAAGSPHRASQAGAPAHTFRLGTDEGLLDGRPFQIRSCEIHPARVPPEYWRHRIRMARALGCNTIAAYVFWNFHEPVEGNFDFSTPARDVGRFVRTAREEGLWVLLRPGPYVCAEWDFGGLPPYLLRDPELRIRCLYPRFMQAAERYMVRLAAVVRPLLVTRGGPILMVQVENEYGSYGNDRAYLKRLRSIWQREGLDVPLFTADGPTPHMLEAGHLPGAAVGRASGCSEPQRAGGRKKQPRGPGLC
jgi:beta-galactosidase GanA